MTHILTTINNAIEAVTYPQESIETRDNALRIAAKALTQAQEIIKTMEALLNSISPDMDSKDCQYLRDTVTHNMKGN